MAISVIENDPEADEQYDTIIKFFEIKGNAKSAYSLKVKR